MSVDRNQITPEISQEANRGWQHCTRLQHEGVRLIVTNSVGPRIIALSLGAGPNLFKEFEDQLGRTSGDDYLLFGGHRLWAAPEAFPRSYAHDFNPVTVVPRPRGALFQQQEEPENRIRKAIEVEFLAGRRFRLVHSISNLNPWTIELAPWAMSLMAAGTRAIVPQEPHGSHPEHLAPARTLTLWPYTRMDDPRVQWGSRFIQVQEDSTINAKFKLGIQNRQRWVATWTHGVLLIRTFGFDPSCNYPDMGCNVELFTMPGFLEMETLGPLQRLAPGATARHEEIWHVRECPTFPDEHSALAELISACLPDLQFPDTRT